jgi:hypothetical protein
VGRLVRPKRDVRITQTGVCFVVVQIAVLLYSALELDLLIKYVRSGFIKTVWDCVAAVAVASN